MDARNPPLSKSQQHAGDGRQTALHNVIDLQDVASWTAVVDCEKYSLVVNDCSS